MVKSARLVMWRSVVQIPSRFKFFSWKSNSIFLSNHVTLYVMVKTAKPHPTLLCLKSQWNVLMICELLNQTECRWIVYLWSVSFSNYSTQCVIVMSIRKFLFLEVMYSLNILIIYLPLNRQRRFWSKTEEFKSHPYSLGRYDRTITFRERYSSVKKVYTRFGIEVTWFCWNWHKTVKSKS